MASHSTNFVDFVRFERIVDKPHREELETKYNHFEYDVEEEKLIISEKMEHGKEGHGRGKAASHQKK